MATSPKFGSSSSPRLTREAALARLQILARSATIRELQDILPATPLYIVGGVVRESFLTETAPPLHDLDLAVAGSAVAAMETLTAAGFRTIDTGLAHGTFSVLPKTIDTALFADHLQIQVTAFRTPGDRSQALPATSIEEDLAGRDFTINAIAFGVQSLTLHDPYQGVSDLYTDTLRAVGSAHQRFREDPHRIMRMVRFGTAQRRQIEPATYAAAIELIETLRSVAIERIRDEFTKILMLPAAGDALRKLLELGFFKLFMPEVLPAVQFAQNEFHTEDVFAHTCTVVNRAESDTRVRLAAFFHDLGKPATCTTDENGKRHFYLHEQESAAIAQQVMERLKFSRADIAAVATLVGLHMRPFQCGAAGARRIIRDTGELYPLWRKLKNADAPPRQASEDFAREAAAFDALIAEELARSKTSPFAHLAINGRDLMQELQLPSSPTIGVLLRQLHEAVLDNPATNNRETLLLLARRMLAGTPPPSASAAITRLIAMFVALRIPLAIFGTIVILTLFNYSVTSEPSAEQEAFAAFVQQVASAEAGDSSLHPVVTMQLSPTSVKKIAGNSPQLTRILELLRESRVIDQVASKPLALPAAPHVTVETGTTASPSIFIGSFSERELSKNPALRNALVLATQLSEQLQK